jgi:ABC-type polysaccharide/polyol phosphate transport system ATPase subunit
MNATNDTVVSVSGVSKRFLMLGGGAFAQVKRILPRRLLRDPDSSLFTALSDVTFDVRKGEMVGVIGPNGSGKTTLLKLIAGLLPIDEGVITVKGKVNALLALGVGVNPDFTGRENIIYGGLLLGMTRREIEERLPQIVEFSEIGAFIDQPFRTYSSGMRARLLFSISMSLTPDILIVDEALAAGDAAFVEKCHGRVRQLLAAGVTLLFVSHNIGQIRLFCDRCLVLERGRLIFDGATDAALRRYVESWHRTAAQRLTAPDTPRRESPGSIAIEDVYFSASGSRTRQLIIGEPCQLNIELRSDEPHEVVSLCAEVRSEKSATTYAFLSQAAPLAAAQCPPAFAVPRGRARLVVEIPALICGDGNYSLDLELFSGEPGYRFAYETCYVHQRRALQWQAVYRGEQWFGRGVLTEIPVSAVRLEARGDGQDRPEQPSGGDKHASR